MERGEGCWVEDLLREILRCTVLEGVEVQAGSHSIGEPVLPVENLTRCGHRYYYSLKRPEDVADYYVGSDDLFLLSLYRKGFLEILKRASKGGRLLRGEEIEVESPYSVVVSTGPMAGWKARIVGVVDAYFPKSGRLLLARKLPTAIKPPRGGEGINLPRRPPEHHIDLALLYQWLLISNGRRVDEVHILYYDRDGVPVREYVVRSALNRNMEKLEGFEDFVRSRLITVLRGEGPMYGWDCNYCPFQDKCPYRVIPKNSEETGEARKGVRLDTEYYEVEVWDDPRMPLASLILRNLVELDLERTLRREPAGRTPTTIWVTSLAYCPLKAWFSIQNPFAGTGTSLSRHIIRGKLINYAYDYLLEKLRDRECYSLLKESWRLPFKILGVNLEEYVEKVFIVDGHPYKVTGKIDAHLTLEDREVIIELKAPAKAGKERKWYELQLAAYLEIYRDKAPRRRIEGLLLEITVEEGEETSHGRLAFHCTPYTLEELTNKILEDNRQVKESVIEHFLNEIHSIARGIPVETREDKNEQTVRIPPVPRYSWECNFCPFRGICPYAASKR
ncbi:MAG: PD-(D/E)XK nuclease family protein [Desulfurococcales archaeon]|nr:PD-(D/E)XK nuclease family protein [Desulfurococcales archaeon]